MSGIIGIFRRDGQDVDPADIKRMNDKIAHRGPDGSRVWCEGPVAFGHQMLHTTQESLHEILPFEDEESGLVITADARIDNRKDLAPRLGIENSEYVSDSYFILKAYEKWGEKCPEELLGDFAFAIWDGYKLFCAKDHMGVRSFYYYLSDDIFLFSTEIKAFFVIKEVPHQLNEEKLALYLMKDTANEELTFYENIKNLPSANFLMLDNHMVKMNKYWKLDPNLRVFMGSEDEYSRAFFEIFAEAIECRLRTPFPLGFELSGGLDSSSIVCMAKEIFKKDLIFDEIYTFSRIFDETPESDERYYINKVINNLGFNSYFINVDKVSPLENIEDVLRQQDQPFYTPHMTKQIITYQKMNELGLRVILSGHGGDHNFFVGNYFRELAITFQWKKLAREIKEFSHKFNKSTYNILFEKIVIPSIPYIFKNLLRSLFGKNHYFINKFFLNRLSIDENYQKKCSDDLSRMNSREYHYHILNYAFHGTVFGTIDRRVPIFNIDVRFPFYDKRLIEFCYSLPSEMKYKNGWSKYILRLTMENILPKEIQWRLDKADLSHSYKKNLLLEKDILEEMIYKDNPLIDEYVNLKNLQDTYEKYESNINTNVFELWLVVLAYLWLKLTKIKKRGSVNNIS